MKCHEMTRQRKSSKTIAFMFSWSFLFIESTSIASTDGRTTRVMTKPKPRSVITKIRAWSNSQHFKFTWNKSWVMILVLQILILIIRPESCFLQITFAALRWRLSWSRAVLSRNLETTILESGAVEVEVGLGGFHSSICIHSDQLSTICATPFRERASHIISKQQYKKVAKGECHPCS